ncbi:MAG: hypothetical protein LBD76_06755 [Prevotellaceae bacterium]|jgi:trigger factor|nr:hypothetical protein [Prevotellaceae bacterium]
MELIQNKEGLVATLTVKVSQEDYAAKVEKELRKIRQTSQIKGFRPGNAPISLIKKMYGTSLMVEEINKLVLKSIKDYEQENVERILAQVIPSEQNQILTNYGEQKELEFVYEAGFFPEFTYKIDENTELPYYNIILEDEDIDAEIKGYCDMHSTEENVEAIEDECIISTDVNLVKDGEETTCSTNFLMRVIPDEHKQVFLDAKVNAAVDVEIRKVFANEIDLMGMLKVNKDELDLLPENLTFTITKIVKIMPAQINQDLFDKIAGKDKIHSEEELREYAKNAILADYSAMSLDKLFKDSIEILFEKANLDMPKTFIEKYIRFLEKEDDETSEENFESAVNFFTRESKWKYIMSSLLTQNDIRITYDTLKEELRAILQENYPKHSGYHYSDEELGELLNIYRQNEEYMQYIMRRITNRQLAYLLKKNAKLNVKDVTIEEFQTLYYKNDDNVLTNNAVIENGVNDETPAIEEPVTADTETVNTVNQENNNEEIQ